MRYLHEKLNLASRYLVGLVTAEICISNETTTILFGLFLRLALKRSYENGKTTPSLNICAVRKPASAPLSCTFLKGGWQIKIADKKLSIISKNSYIRHFFDPFSHA